MIAAARLSAWDLVPRQIATVSVTRFASASLVAVAVALSAFAGWGLMPTGDGALHVNLSRQIFESGSLSTDVVSHYPPLFHLLGAVGYGIAGPVGVQWVSFLAFGFASVFTYLFVSRLTGSSWAGLAAQALVTFSPVMLWHSSLILMEPLLTAAIMASLYFVLRAKADPSRANLVYASVSLASVALIKQTGLPVVGASILFLAISSVGVKRAGLVALIVGLIAAGPYMFVYSRTGAFTDPGQIPVSKITERGSAFPGSILIGGLEGRVEPWSAELDAEVDGVALYERGTVIHKSRHVYWKNLWQWPKLTWVHTLYPDSYNGYQALPVPGIRWLLNLGFVAGFLTALYIARRDANWRLVLLTLGASYVAMSWGSDTKRLFLYVPVVASALLILPFHIALRRLADRFRESLQRQKIREIGIPVAGVATALLLAIMVVPVTLAQFGVLSEHDATQGGGFPSVGGMDSIQETGDWLNDYLAEDEMFVAASVYEWEYYSERGDLWDEGLDYRAYFLPAERLDHFLNEAGARYIVIRQSQLIDDEDWNHVEKVPRSFSDRVEAAYPLVYTSSYGDIKVYEVTALDGADA